MSVYYKDGLEDLAALFKEKGVHVLSTGGTAKKMRELGCTVQDVAEYTGSPEILDGRVKTLHPKIHGGILNVRGHAPHEEECAKHGIRIIDVVVANLYPFELALQQNLGHASAIENIDIGGPCMVRASAKSHQGCAILSDPSACSRRQKLLDLKTRAVVIDANRNSFEYIIKFSVAVFFFFRARRRSILSSSFVRFALICFHFSEEWTNELMKMRQPRTDPSNLHR